MMVAAGSSIGRNDGEQNRAVPVPAPESGEPQSGPASAVSVAHAWPHFEAAAQYPNFSVTPRSVTAPTTPLQTPAPQLPVLVGSQTARQKFVVAEPGRQIRFHSQESTTDGSQAAPA